jgi:hypothetical protein
VKHVRLLLLVAALFGSPMLVDAIPSAPTNLTATVTGNTIVLQWNAVPAVTNYYLAAGLQPGTTIAANLLPAIPGFTAFPIPPGTYYLRVHAVDTTGVSLPSNEAVAVVGGGGPCLGPPAAPTGLTAAVAGLAVSLGFNPGSGGCPVTNYVLHAGSATGLSNITIVNLGPLTSISTLAPPGIYYVRAFAQSATASSGPSNEVVVRVPGGDPLFRQ